MSLSRSEQHVPAIFDTESPLFEPKQLEIPVAPYVTAARNARSASQPCSHVISLVRPDTVDVEQGRTIKEPPQKTLEFYPKHHETRDEKGSKEIHLVLETLEYTHRYTAKSDRPNRLDNDLRSAEDSQPRGREKHRQSPCDLSLLPLALAFPYPLARALSLRTRVSCC